MTKALSLIARRELDGDRSKNATVTSYTMGETATVITNKMPEVKAPDGVSEMSAAKEDAIEITASEFEKLTPVGQCTGPECGAQFYTVPENLDTLAALASDGDIHCTVCASSIDYQSNAELVAMVVANEENTDDNKVDDVTDETAGDDDDEDLDDAIDEDVEVLDDDEEEDDEDSDGDDDEDDEDDKEESSTEESSDSETDDTNTDDTDVTTEESDDKTTDDTPENDAEIATEEVSTEQDEPETTETLRVDVTASLDFDERTVSLAKVVQGTIGVFASVDGQITPLGMLHAVHANEDNQKYFADGNLSTLKKILVAAAETSSDLNALGFRPVVVDIPVSDAIAQTVATATTETASQVDTMVNGRVEDFKQCISIAAAGMSKGFYPNPLTASLSSRLKQRQVTNADQVSARIISESLDDFNRAMLEQANLLMADPQPARDAVARTIRDSNPVVASNETASVETVDPTQVSTALMGGIPSTAALQEVAAQQPTKRFDRKTLFPDNA